MTKGVKTKLPKKPLTDAQKEERARKARERSFIRQHRRIFELAGFSQLKPIDGIHFTFEGMKGEFDDIFVFENVVVICEYTTSSGPNLGDHAKGKDGIFNKVSANPVNFLKFLSQSSQGLAKWMESKKYSDKQLVVRMLYGSAGAVEDHHKAAFNDATFMSDNERSYFAKVTKTIKISSRNELLDFLGVPISMVGEAGVVNPVSFDPYTAIALPEEQSHFPAGFKVVSFYVDPAALLKRCYVLRRNGWRSELGLYQRMIVGAKVSQIRAHIKDQRRVFANNIVVTLPSSTRFFAVGGGTVDFNEITAPTQIMIELPREANSVGIVDGQHRVFSYYEDASPDKLIDEARYQQNLLATGISYPSSYSEQDKQKFEARLFLEINSNQASANTDLKQAIWTILDPFKPESVGRNVVVSLANTFPLQGHLSRGAYDSGKIKTTTIVSYGLLPLLKRSGNDSLFKLWGDADAKARLSAGQKSDDDLAEYRKFCVDYLSLYLDEIRKVLDRQQWNIATKYNCGILSVTTINGFIILLRKLIESGIDYKSIDISKMSRLRNVNFRAFKSSQYADLAHEMYKLVS